MPELDGVNFCGQWDHGNPTTWTVETSATGDDCSWRVVLDKRGARHPQQAQSNSGWLNSDGATPAYLFSYSEAGVRGLAETLAVQVDVGGTQVFSSVMPLADTRRYRLALRYRTTGGLLFVRALRREDVTWGVLKGATGEPVSRLFELWPVKGAEPGWQTFVCTNDVPKVVQTEDAALQRQLQVYPRPDGVGFFEVDDVAVESAVRREPALIERMLAGGPDATSATGVGSTIR